MPPATRRQEIVGAGGLVLLVAAWLIVSPYVLSYEPGDPSWNPILAGSIVLLLALARLTVAIWLSWLSWLHVALGAWLASSALWLEKSATAGWNEALAGTVLVVLGVLGGGATDAARRRTAARG